MEKKKNLNGTVTLQKVPDPFSEPELCVDLEPEPEPGIEASSTTLF